MKYSLSLLAVALTLSAPLMAAQDAAPQSDSEWRQALAQEFPYQGAAAPVVPAATPASGSQAGTGGAPGDDDVTFYFELDKGMENVAELSMSMSRNALDRLRQQHRAYNDYTMEHVTTPISFQQYLALGDTAGPVPPSGKLPPSEDMVLMADFMITKLDKADLPDFLQTPISYMAEAIKAYDHLDEHISLDIFGYDVGDAFQDYFSQGKGVVPVVGDRHSLGSSDGQFHGRFRFGVGGISSVARSLSAKPLTTQLKYHLLCPQNFIFNVIDTGVQIQPTAMGDATQDRFKCYISGSKQY